MEVDKQLSDMVAWLRMLSLPRAVHWALAGVIALAVAAGFALIVAEIGFHQKELASVGATLLVLALPLCLLTLLLVYGRGDAESLNQRTHELLSHTVPRAIGYLLASPAGSRSVSRDASVTTVVRGFIADYNVDIVPIEAGAGQRRRLELTVEVKKGQRGGLGAPKPCATRRCNRASVRRVAAQRVRGRACRGLRCA